jgi:uncharacterized SAM-binding protein YcdF (DUF218 family)
VAQARQHPVVSPHGTTSSPFGLSSACPEPVEESKPGAHAIWPQVPCLVVGLLLMADAFYLMAVGVFSFGVILPLALGIALSLLGWRWASIQRWLAADARRRAAWRWMWVAVLVWVSTVALFWTVLARIASGVSAGPAPATILVLGSGTPNGKASPVLAARLDLALQQARRYPQALVVVSGGVDSSETLSEARLMGDYLRARGLVAARIVQEEKSTSTAENLLLTKALLEQRGVSADAPVRLVTSDFHTLRARWIAERAGYAQVSLAGAATPLYVRYNAWLREYFAVLSGWALREFG